MSIPNCNRGLARFGAILAGIALLSSSAIAQTAEGPTRKRVTQAERQAAADRAKAKGFVAPKYTGETTTVTTTTVSKNGGGTADFVAPPVDPATAVMTPGAVPKYFSVGNYANSPLYTGPGTGIRKFVDTLPGLGAANKNNLGQYIPVAVPDTTTYPGSDYYEIAVVDFQEKMHSDLPATRLRGYVQLSTAVVPGARFALSNPDNSPINLPNGQRALAVEPPHYLGPTIVAQKDRPVRILFRNLLRPGSGGNLFVPVDTTVMGAGWGPNKSVPWADPNPQRPVCGVVPKDARCYTENRATLHLHGGATPWISDGTPHQWITPAGDTTPYKQGVSVANVPDMPDPGPGAQTFFYTNQQSARLLFYHDHSWGITRLNVYAGEAAPLIITDDTEKALVQSGTIPAEQIPLVVQDKTFVPTTAQLAVQDPTWDIARWGGLGALWVPHVYSPAQNPGDTSGVNQYGRWAYSQWFWPPPVIEYGPIQNPYYDPACNPDVQWCEPPLIPGTPYVSMGMEAFNDTPLVNGTVYPVLNVDPKTYRFRILNAANDRVFNLSFYKADPAASTEVQLNPAEVALALTDPTIFPTPVVGTEGPSWIQIGTEGGFLPSPVTIPPAPTTWVTDPTVFNAGNVAGGSLIVAPAERADVIVDFSAYAGQTLILYNDAPAAFPARDPRYDYYTGSPDLTETGGAPPVVPGYGPNTRTVMKVVVANKAPAAPFDTQKLDAAFAHHLDSAGKPAGVFESSQHPIVVAQGAYNLAYGKTWQNNGPRAGLAQIFDTQLTFDTLAGTPLTMPLTKKSIQDEQGEAFDHTYGRMSGNLGLQVTAVNNQQLLVLYPYVNPPTEVFNGIELPPGISVTPITTTTDGTQLWKITHNGVDTHPIHFHMFDIQLINRVGWDGIIRKPELNELGWKETVRISPLEDTIVAMRPLVPKLPFGVRKSVRPLHPAIPLGANMDFNQVGPDGNAFNPPITNELFTFDWEYVWHCHILSHEEMDMMRPYQVNVQTTLPATPVLSSATAFGAAVNLSWTDPTPNNYVQTGLAQWGNLQNEVGFYVERAGATGAYTRIATALANQTTFTDTTTRASTTYRYRVIAFNASGNTVVSNVRTVTTSTAPAPATSVTLSANPASPQLVGTAVTFTAQGAGGSGQYQYRFSVDEGNGFYVARDWNTLNTFVFQPGVAKTYQVRVAVRTSVTVTNGDATNTVAYTFNPAFVGPATGATLTANLTSPQPVGTPITFTAQGQGSTNYQYRFWLRPAGGTWAVVQDYGLSNTWVMPTTTPAGNWEVAVHVRTTDAVFVDVQALMSFVIGDGTAPGPATGATLTSDLASPQPAGTAVTFTAQGQGSTGAYQYRFWLFENGAWTVVQDYSANNTWVMPTTTLAGNYQVAVHVRTSDAVFVDVQALMPFVIGTPTTYTPATGVTLTANPTSPAPAGTAILFTAQGQGSTDPYQYRFWIFRNGAWEVVQDYSATNTWTMPSTTAAGTYDIAVHVRTDPTKFVDVQGLTTFVLQ